ncbi:MAG: DUF456 domain-containing protein [Halanaerobiales bacterium]
MSEIIISSIEVKIIIYLIWFIIIILFIGSLIGVILPFIPDTILLWIAYLIYEISVPGKALPFSFWSGMLLLSALILSSDFLANVYFVKKHGGSRLAMLGAAVGLILGTIFMGPIGILVGPFLLVFIIAYLEKKDSNKAVKIGAATILAFFSSSIVKIFLQVIMIIWFLILVL